MSENSEKWSLQIKFPSISTIPDNWQKKAYCQLHPLPLDEY